MGWAPSDWQESWGTLEVRSSHNRRNAPACQASASRCRLSLGVPAQWATKISEEEARLEWMKWRHAGHASKTNLPQTIQGAIAWAQTWGGVEGG